MFTFILRKMISKRWMVLALLLGNILLISITCANAMYGASVLQRTLTRSLEDTIVERNQYPARALIETSGLVNTKNEIYQAAELAVYLPDACGLPLVERVVHLSVGPTSAADELQREKGVPRSLSIGSLRDLQDHIQIVAGELYSDLPAEDGTVDVMVSERGAIEMNLILNERIVFPKYLLENGEPLKVRVCGVFRNTSDEDPYWVLTPSSFSKEFLMPDGIFQRLFVENAFGSSLNAQFYVLMDYTAIKGEQAQELRNTAAAAKAMASGIRGVSYSDNFSSVLDSFLAAQKKVNVTLWVLQAPIFALLAVFIFMVSRQMLDMEQNEIAVIKSRGASRGQIITTYLLQSLATVLIALVISLPLGALLVQVLGSANAFLEFVGRSALPVRITGKVLLFSAAAALFSVGAMVLPVFRHADVTIVNHKQKKHRKSDAPLWQKLFLDVAVLGVSLYGLYTYNGQKEILAERVMDGASLDPLLFISSSLFMIGAGLFALRILPAITYLVFRLFRKKWSPAMYAAFLQVIRTRYSQGFIMVFLVLTIALGIFNAQAARTINSNEEENISYKTGADLVVMERWNDNGALIASGAATELEYVEPDYGVYRDMEGVKASTKVLVNKNVSMSVPEGKLKNVSLMGIHTKTFGETAWFKDGLLPHHFFAYLNALASDSRAVLLSSNFRDNYRYKLGDAINIRNAEGTPMRGIVYGFVDYWPSYARYSYTKGTDGVYRQDENYLIVANLAQVQANWGVTPYQIWIDAEDSTAFIYDYAQQNEISYRIFQDTSAEIVSLKNDPVFQGTNGILTVGFIVVLLLCAVGFLIYWILSIQSRALQFGIYRAMGMSMREIITMLLGEQIFISATSIVTGVFVGLLTSRLYMPFIQMAYAAYDSALPLRVLSAPSDMIRIIVMVGLMIVVCMAVLGWLISRMKIAQVLKLGED